MNRIFRFGGIRSGKNAQRSDLAAPSVIRARVRDVAFAYRMSAGFAGDVTRSPSLSTIEPCLIDVNAPPTAYGQPVVIDPTTQGVRPLVAGDSALTAIYGITVRSFPVGQQSTTNFGSVGFGPGTPPTSGVIDILRRGYILAPVNGAVLKGGALFIWVAASSGAHVQGGFEAATGGGSNTIALDAKSSYNGPADVNGNAEISFNI